MNILNVFTVQSAKLLCIYLTDKLNISQHIEQTVAVFNQRLYLLCQVKQQSVKCLDRIFDAVIVFQIHFVRLVSPASIHLLIQLSTHPCHHRHSHHPSLLQSFTPGSKPTFSTNPSHLNILLYSLDCLHENGTGLDVGLSCSSVYF